MPKPFRCPHCHKAADRLHQLEGVEKMMCLDCLLVKMPKSDPMRPRYESMKEQR